MKKIFFVLAIMSLSLPAFSFELDFSCEPTADFVLLGDVEILELRSSDEETNVLEVLGSRPLHMIPEPGYTQDITWPYKIHSVSLDPERGLVIYGVNNRPTRALGGKPAIEIAFKALNTSIYRALPGDDETPTAADATALVTIYPAVSQNNEDRPKFEIEMECDVVISE